MFNITLPKVKHKWRNYYYSCNETRFSTTSILWTLNIFPCETDLARYAHPKVHRRKKIVRTPSFLFLKREGKEPHVSVAVIF